MPRVHDRHPVADAVQNRRSWEITAGPAPGRAMVRASRSSIRSRDAGVQGTGRFVGDQHPRIGRQTAGQRDPLALPPGQLVGVAAEPARRAAPPPASSCRHAIRIARARASARAWPTVWRGLREPAGSWKSSCTRRRLSSQTVSAAGQEILSLEVHRPRRAGPGAAPGPAQGRLAAARFPGQPRAWPGHRSRSTPATARGRAPARADRPAARIPATRFLACSTGRSRRDTAGPTGGAARRRFLDSPDGSRIQVHHGYDTAGGHVHRRSASRGTRSAIMGDEQQGHIPLPARSGRSGPGSPAGR